jgi:hypothetical protein
MMIRGLFSVHIDQGTKLLKPQCAQIVHLLFRCAITRAVLIVVKSKEAIFGRCRFLVIPCGGSIKNMIVILWRTGTDYSGTYFGRSRPGLRSSTTEGGGNEHLISHPIPGGTGYQPIADGNLPTASNVFLPADSSPLYRFYQTNPKNPRLYWVSRKKRTQMNPNFWLCGS